MLPQAPKIREWYQNIDKILLDFLSLQTYSSRKPCTFYTQITVSGIIILISRYQMLNMMTTCYLETSFFFLDLFTGGGKVVPFLFGFLPYRFVDSAGSDSLWSPCRVIFAFILMLIKRRAPVIWQLLYPKRRVELSFVMNKKHAKLQSSPCCCFLMHIWATGFPQASSC